MSPKPEDKEEYAFWSKEKAAADIRKGETNANV